MGEAAANLASHTKAVQYTITLACDGSYDCYNAANNSYSQLSVIAGSAAVRTAGGGRGGCRGSLAHTRELKRAWLRGLRGLPGEPHPWVRACGAPRQPSRFHRCSNHPCGPALAHM